MGHRDFAGARRVARGLTIAACVVALSFAGCRSMRVQREAREFADRYYATLRDAGLDAALPLYHEDFWESTPLDEWRTARELVADTLGPIDDFRMTKWNMEVLPSGSFVTLEYEVRYARGSSHDTLTVVRPGRSDDCLVYGHRVHSPELR